MLRLKSTVTNLAITSKAIGIYNEDTEVVSIDFDGQASFAGLTEHAGGVSVTGGDLAVQDGRISVVPNNSDGSNRAWLYSVEGTVPNTTTDGRFFYSRPTYAGTGTLPSIVHFQAQPQTRPPAGLTITTQIGFSASSNLEGATVTNAYGFYSSLSATGVNSYNFYAAGAAPNYFAGQVINGVSTDPNAYYPNTGNANGWVGQATSFNIKRSTNDTAACLYVTRNCGGNATRNGREFIQFNAPDNGGELGKIQQNSGRLEYHVTSDYRIKSNIQPLASSTELIKNLNPVSYTLNHAPEYTHSGFIAHELQEYVPNMVSGTKDATEEIGTVTDYDGTELETNVTQPSDLTYEEQVEVTPYVAPVAATYDEYGNELTPAVDEVEATYTTVTRTRTWTSTGTKPVYQGLDQTKLIPLLTKALQEALERIEALEAQLNP